MSRNNGTPFGNLKSVTNTNSFKAPAMKTTYAPKTKGAMLNNTPVVDPALKALAYNKRKKIKIG